MKALALAILVSLSFATSAAMAQDDPTKQLPRPLPGDVMPDPDPEYIFGKVSRYWQWLEATDRFASAKIFGWAVQRCGPRACRVTWWRGNKHTELSGSDACFVRKGRVRCVTRWIVAGEPR